MTKLEKVLSLTKLQAKVLYFIEENTGMIGGWYYSATLKELCEKVSTSTYMVKRSIDKLISLDLVGKELTSTGKPFKYSASS